MKFVKLSYTGKLEDGKVFDTTDAETARKNKIFDEKRIYKPISIIVGEGHVIKGLDEALKDAKVGDKKTVNVTPENGYGPRNPELVRLVPMRVFKKQNIRPIPGMVIDIDGRPARIQTVAGGRVRVDLNHELAGRTLNFDVKVESEAKTDMEKIDCLIDRSFNDVDGFKISAEGKKIRITLPENASRDRNLLIRKASLAAELFKYIEAEQVDFVEEWKNPKKETKGVAKAGT